MAAGTIGTFLGVGFSTSLATSSHAFVGFGTAFFGLACLHQGFHYISLRAVALRHMNRHRLNILLEQYVSSGNVLTPAAVAQRESIRPFLPTTQAMETKIGFPSAVTSRRFYEDRCVIHC
jgi:Vitamin B6 photo-protection and homoeostasis